MPWLSSVVAVQFSFAVLPWVRVWPYALYVAFAGLLSGYIIMVFSISFHCDVVFSSGGES